MPRITPPPPTAKPDGAGLLAHLWEDSHGGSKLSASKAVRHVRPRSIRSKLSWLAVFTVAFVFLVFRLSSFVSCCLLVLACVCAYLHFY